MKITSLRRLKPAKGGVMRSYFGKTGHTCDPDLAGFTNSCSNQSKPLMGENNHKGAAIPLRQVTHALLAGIKDFMVNKNGMFAWCCKSIYYHEP